jgi:hypothetical protein
LAAACPNKQGPVVLTDKPFAFDITSVKADDNGFLEDPWWGIDGTQVPDGGPPDPRGCSWRFLDGGGPFLDGGVRPNDRRLPCNSKPVDPDFSTQALSDLGFTCMDSTLNMRGHINWGAHWGGAVTFNGTIRFESYSGGYPNDSDYNFLLAPPPGRTMTLGSGGWIKLEFDSAEVNEFGSDWWTTFEKTVFEDPDGAAGLVGQGTGIATGLLGLDTEHDNSLELHPLYALALNVSTVRVAGEPCGEEHDLTTWAFFVRDEGNQGGCSRAERVHSIQFPNHAYKFRLPVASRGCLAIKRSEATFSASSGDSNAVSIDYKESQPENGILLTVKVEPGETVDGVLKVHSTPGPAGGVPAAALPPPPPPSDEWKEFKQKVSELKSTDSDGHDQLVASAGRQKKPPIMANVNPNGAAPRSNVRRPVQTVVKAPAQVHKSPEQVFCEKRGNSITTDPFCKPSPESNKARPDGGMPTDAAPRVDSGPRFDSGRPPDATRRVDSGTGP